jgi:flagellar protein FliS
MAAAGRLLKPDEGQSREGRMNGFGAKVYQRVGVDSSVASADPHQLILMLFDGALEALRLARSHMEARRIADKGQALGKAISIVQDGLKASVDSDAGGQLAARLASLYDYILMRLLQANLRNDVKALDEVVRLLNDLRSAWAGIAGAPDASTSAGDPHAARRANVPGAAATPGADPASRLAITA